MAKITCYVGNCSHNDKNVCYANVVNVGGKSAKKDSDTSCGSFLNSTIYSKLTNNVNDQGRQCSAITCNVGTCSYNSNSLCSAKSIKVSGEGVNIYTETNCITFKTK